MKIHYEFNQKGLAAKGYFVAGFEFFLPSGFDDAIQTNFATLDNDLGLTAGTDQPRQFHELVELNSFFSFVHRLIYR